MDDVDAVQANISRTMLHTGDWVTARLDGVKYLEKAPLIYWAIAASYRVFGVHEWAARIPVALSAMALCWLTAAFGIWAFGKRAGFYAGLVMSTCIGLFLFTRILIPDVMLVFTIALAMWSFLRALDEGEKHPRLWAASLAACIGTGLLLKSLIGALFPVASGVIYLLLTRQFFVRRTWQRLRPVQRSAHRSWQSQCPGTSSPPSAIRLISTSQCRACRASITASCGSFSSMSSYSDS